MVLCFCALVALFIHGRTIVEDDVLDVYIANHDSSSHEDVTLVSMMASVMQAKAAAASVGMNNLLSFSPSFPVPDASPLAFYVELLFNPPSFLQDTYKVYLLDTLKQHVQIAAYTSLFAVYLYSVHLISLTFTVQQVPANISFAIATTKHHLHSIVIGTHCIP